MVDRLPEFQGPKYAEPDRQTLVAMWHEKDCKYQDNRRNHQRLQPLSDYRQLKIGEPGEIAAGMNKASNNTECDRIANLHEYDRDGMCRLRECGGCGTTTGDNQIRLHRNQFFRECLCPIALGGFPAIVEPEIAAVEPPGHAEPQRATKSNRQAPALGCRPPHVTESSRGTFNCDNAAEACR